MINSTKRYTYENHTYVAPHVIINFFIIIYFMCSNCNQELSLRKMKLYMRNSCYVLLHALNVYINQCIVLIVHDLSWAKSVMLKFTVVQN